MRFVGNVSALFVVAVSHGLDTNPAAVRLFRKRLVKGFGRWPGGLQAFSLFLGVGSKSNVSAVFWLRFRMVWALFFLKLIQRHCSPNAFRRQHFGIVRGRCFAWFRHESCCCSAVAQAVRQRLGTLVFDV